MKAGFRSLFVISALSLGLATAQAQDFPSGLVKIVVPSAPGSAPDIVARLLSDGLTKSLGQSVIVENKPGGNGIVGMNTLQRAAPDGHTIGLFHAAAAITTPIMYKEADFDVQKDTEIVSSIAYTPMIFVANKESGYQTLGDFIAAAKKEPGEIVIGSPRHGSIPHLTAALLGQLAGVDLRFVNFSGTTQAIQSLVGGDIPAYVDGTAPLLPLIEAGRIVALADTADEVLPGLEEIPLANATVSDAVAKGWFVMFAPKGTPEAVLERLHGDISNILKEPAMMERLKDLGTYPIIETRAQTRDFLDREQAVWAKVIKEANVQPQ